MISKFGARVTMFTGSVISTIGLVISSQVTNIYLLALFVGIVTGKRQDQLEFLNISWVIVVMVPPEHWRQWHNLWQWWQ